MRLLIVLAFLACALLPSTAHADLQADLEAMIRNRDARFAVSVPPETQWSVPWDQPVRNYPAPDEPTIRLVLQLRNNNSYRTALIAQLRSPAAIYRGLACELLELAHVPDAIEPLGRLLDDQAESAPTVRRTIPQAAGAEQDYLLRPAVAQLARHALWRHTGVLFRSKADFDTWWMSNKDCANHIWYWAAKWNMSHLEPMVVEGRLIANQQDYTADLKQLSALPADTALKLLLLFRNDAARRFECPDSEGAKLDLSYSSGRGPDGQAIQAFAREHDLKARLLDLLAQKNLWTEVGSQEAFSGLIRRIADLGPGLFGPADELRIAAAQRVNSPLSPPTDVLAIARADAAPARAFQILSEALRTDPRMLQVARRIVKMYGLPSGSPVADAFRQASPLDQQWIAQNIASSAEAGLHVDMVVLTALVRSLSYAPDTAATHDHATSIALAELGKAVNTVACAEVVSQIELDSLRPQMTKGPETEDTRAHNAAIPQAFAEVKAKLLTIQ